MRHPWGEPEGPGEQKMQTKPRLALPPGGVPLTLGHLAGQTKRRTRDYRYKNNHNKLQLLQRYRYAHSIELTQMREMLILSGTLTFTQEVIFNLNLKGRKDSQLCSGNCRVWHIGEKTPSKEGEVIPLDKQKPDYERHQLSCGRKPSRSFKPKNAMISFFSLMINQRQYRIAGGKNQLGN